MFHGSMVALVTPMKEDGSIDYDSLRALVQWHIEAKTDALVVAGTTGESGALVHGEKLKVIRTVMDEAKGRVPVIAGTGAISTQATIDMTRDAMGIGVDAALIMTPPYVKPTQEGLYQHYRAITKEVAIPIIVYNVPSRTACDITPQTIARLCPIPNIVGVKEASGDPQRSAQILENCQGHMDVYSGDDAIAYDVMALGGRGVISVTANVAPKLMHEMCAALLNDEMEKARTMNDKLMPLHKGLFIESNPIPTKWALAEMNLIPRGIRLPLTNLSQENQAIVKRAMEAADCI